jgi:hypothetical protein
MESSPYRVRLAIELERSMIGNNCVIGESGYDEVGIGNCSTRLDTMWDCGIKPAPYPYDAAGRQVIGQQIIAGARTPAMRHPHGQELRMSKNGVALEEID